MRFAWTAFLTTAVMATCLVAWRLLLPITDLAVFPLIVLALPVWFGHFLPLRQIRRVEAQIMLLPGSVLRRWMTGRLSSLMVASAMTLAIVPAMGFAVFRAGLAELLALAMITVVTSVLVLAWQRRLGRQLIAPFARHFGAVWGAWLAAIIGAVLLAWLNFNVIARPGYLVSSDMAGAIAAALREVPPRSPWLTTPLSAMTALDTALLWIVARFNDSAWAGSLYSLNAAVFAFAFARSVAAVTEFTLIINKETEP